MSGNGELVLQQSGGGILDAAVRVAEKLQKAEGMIPKHFLNNPGKIIAAILAGHELGVGPMASMRAFHVVEGKPCADYSFWIARLKAASYKVEWKNCTEESATLILTAPDGTQHEETWNKARAMTAGLWGRNTWKAYPGTMLRARCVTSAGRAFAAEVMFGCYETDEADEIRAGSAETEPSGALAGKTGTARLAERIGAVPQVTAEPATPEAIESARMDAARALAQLFKDHNFDRADVQIVLGDCELPRDAQLSKLSPSELERVSGRVQEILAERAAAMAERDGDAGDNGGTET